MPEPSIGIAKAAFDFANLVWEKSVSFLWFASLVCGLLLLALFAAAYFQIPTASDWLPKYELLLVCGLVVCSAAAILRTYLDYRAAHCLRIHFGSDRRDYVGGWRLGAVAAHAQHFSQGREYLPLIRTHFYLTNTSPKDLLISSFDLRLSGRKVETFAKSLEAHGQAWGTQIVLPGGKTVDLEIAGFFVMDIPDMNKAILIDVVLLDHLWRKHKFRKISVRPVLNIHDTTTGGPSFSP